VTSIPVQIPGILLMLMLLYFVGNGTAKAVCERRLPEIAE
jgi:hypothetical protein